MIRLASILAVLSIPLAFALWIGWQRFDSVAPGLVVTPVDDAAKPDDVKRLLDIHSWAFDVAFNRPVQGVDCELMVRKKGMSPTNYGGFATLGAVDPSERRHGFHDRFFVSLVPTTPDLASASKVKVVFSASDASSESIHDNLFSGEGVSSGTMIRRQDGTYVLLGGYKKGGFWPPSGADTELFLVVKPIRHYRQPPPERQTPLIVGDF